MLAKSNSNLGLKLDPNNLHGPKLAQEFDKFTWQIYMELELTKNQNPNK